MDKGQGRFYTNLMNVQYILTALVCAGVGLFSLPGDAAAQVTSEVSELIQNYAKAVNSGDETKTNVAWEAISQSAQAQAYLRQSDPRLFHSYEYWRLKRKLQQIRQEHGLPESNPAERALIKSGREIRSNGDRVRTDPNQDRSPNSARGMVSPNQDRRSNQQVVADAPNQDRDSNQDRIRSRLHAAR